MTKMLYTRKGYFTYNGFVQGFRGRREREGSSAWDDSYESSITEGQVLGFLKCSNGSSTGSLCRTQVAAVTINGCLRQPPM